MAFSTGTALSGSALLSAVSSFMTTNGWSIIDTVASDDIVFTSQGTNGKLTMYMRLTLNSSVNNPYNKSSNSFHRIIPALMVRGYHSWNPATHIGTNEYGISGPLIYATMNTGSAPPNGTPNAAFAWRVDRQSGSVLTENPNSYQWDGTDHAFTYRGQGDVGLIDYTGDRYAVFTSGTAGKLNLIDIMGQDTGQISSLTSPVRSFSWNPGCLVYDSTNDRHVFYTMTDAASVPGDAFQKFDIELDTWTKLASTPFNVNQAQGGGFSLWDGGDNIYTVVGNVTSSFYKYSIGGNTWTALSGTPVTRNNSYIVGNNSLGFQLQCKNFVYLSSSLTSLSSDVIYTILDNTTPTIYSYNVNTGKWNDAGTPNISAPLTASSADAIMIFDNAKYLYYWKRTTSPYMWRMDATNIAGGWSTVGAVDYQAISIGFNPIVLNSPVGKVRFQNGSLNTYWIFGNADSISIVTKIPTSSPHYYWAHFGRPQLRRRSAIMTAVSASSVGTNVSFTVDSTSAYSSGDYVYLVDPSNVTKQEFTRISIVNDATHLQMSVKNSYSSGTFIATDPFQSMITGDMGLVCAAADPKGYKYDMEPALYFLQPTLADKVYPVDRTVSSVVQSQDGLGYIQPIEPVIYASRDNPYYPRAKRGIYGSLNGVFFIPNSGYPGPVSEDTITFSGKTYYFFVPTVASKNGRFPFGVVLGPAS